jgi:predicted alpha/beta-fold hydrolase
LSKKRSGSKILTASYVPPFFLFNAHLETIFPSLLRRIQDVAYQRERINTPDGDFLDIDWLRHPPASRVAGERKLAIITHGLEGDTFRPYMRGMAKACFNAGLDVLTWNYRGCSQEMNRLPRFYHGGATDDLETVVHHAMSAYGELYLVGFSMGGNITLKYLGEQTRPAAIRKAAVFSVPLDLHSTCTRIAQPENRIYARRFLKSLKRKIVTKAALMPGFDTTGIDALKTLQAFDDRYTAPLHGFANAIDYYTQSSSLYYLDGIDRPVLIVNAQNDPFLSPASYPVAQLQGHAHILFETPPRGGHVGFAQFHKNGLYWSESRALDFLTHD